ncbi:hypothetical protein TrLO_g3088 [Triparma laevis f. longispina]|uniref:Myb-like domain-containing protein n=1 Tax=Triparma laevis f. longispina TaxID=1714387 RepID=A0A9W7CG27_9STRA|nr:hypothetical protein TrLO_g3088 [Triparma laevis f. longispina]
MTSKAKTKKTKKSVNPPPSLTSTYTSSTSFAKKGEATSQVERDAQTAMDMLSAELQQVHNKFHSLSQDALAVNNKIVTLGRKRKEAMGIDTRNVKKVKSALPKVKTPNGLGFVWTAEEDTALVEGINEYGLDFGCIKAEAGALLGGRKAQALYEHFRKYHPNRFEELREVTPMNHGCCLVRGGRRSAEEGGIDARLRLRDNQRPRE